jgi:hypothetical protein
VHQIEDNNRALHCMASGNYENLYGVCCIALEYVQSYGMPTLNYGPVLAFNIKSLPSKDNHTSKKPLMKFGGSLAFGSSSARKYLRM